jgi:hypothetical protein
MPGPGTGPRPGELGNTVLEAWFVRYVRCVNVTDNKIIDKAVPAHSMMSYGGSRSIAPLPALKQITLKLSSNKLDMQ